MGIRNLKGFIERRYRGYISHHLSSLKGKKIAIDTNLYMYKFMYNNENYLNHFYNMIGKFRKYNIVPIFIFDGKPPKEKQKTLEERKEVRIEREKKIEILKTKIRSYSSQPEVVVKEKDINMVEIEKELNKLEAENVKVTRDKLGRTKELFKLMGIPFIQGDMEAELLSVKLCDLKIADCVMSDDTDVIALGCKMVLTNYNIQNEYIDVFYLNKILFDLKLDYKSFLDLCILLGNDYVDRPKGLSVDDCYKIIKRDKCFENIKLKETIDYNKIRDLYNLQKVILNQEKISEEIINCKENLELLETFIKDNQINI